MSPTRKMLIHGTVTNNGKRIEADFKAAGFYRDEVTLKMTAVRSKREYSGITTLRFGPKEYYLKTKVGMLPKGKAIIYSPELIFSVDGQEKVKFDSSFFYNPKAKITANFKLDKVFSKIVAANMVILLQNTKKRMKHKLNFDLKAPQTSVDIMGFMDLKESRFMSRVITTYNIGKYQDKLTISSKLLDKSTKSLSFYDGDITVDSKRDQKKNFMLKGQFGKADHHLETQLSLEFGNPKRNPEILKFASILNYHFKPQEKNFNYTMSFTRPSKNVDVGFKLSHVNSRDAIGTTIESDVELKYGPEKTVGTKVQFMKKDRHDFNFEGFVSIRHLEKELFRLEDKMTSHISRNYTNHLSVTYPGGKTVTLQSAIQKQSDMSFYMGNTLRLPNNREVKINGRLNIERENGTVFVEVDADRGTIRNEPWNPKLNFNYHIKVHRQKLDLYKMVFGIVLSPKEHINIEYSVLMSGAQSGQSVQELLVTTPFEYWKRIELKSTITQRPMYYKENFMLKIDDYFSYDEEFTLQMERGNFLLDYMFNQKVGPDENTQLHIKASSNRQTTMGMIKYKSTYNTVDLEMNVDHTPNTVDVKADANMSLPRNGFTFKMSSVSTVNRDEFSFNSKGEINLQHPRAVMDMTYFARADVNRITLDANFVSPTSRHRNGKLAIDIAFDDRRRNLTGKFDVDYNDSRLYSLNAGYKFERDVHNFQLAFLLPNGERITTVFNLGMSPKQTVYAELKLPRAFRSFELELDMNGFVECMTETCNHHLRITTNSPSFPNLFVEMKRAESGSVDFKAQLNAFKKNMDFMAKLEGEDWYQKTIMSNFNLDGQEKLNLEGSYMIHSPRNFNAKFLVKSKIGRHDDKFNFNVHRDVVSGEEGELEISAMLELFNKKYEISLMGKNFQEIKGKLMTPNFNYVVSLKFNRLMWNDFDVMLEVKQDSNQYRIAAFNRHFQEMKLSAAMPSYSDFDITYKGGIDDRKRGNFQLKISYGEYFVEGDTTINMSNQLELKSTVSFKVFSWLSRKEHDGSGEIKVKHNFDSIFQKITGNFVYGKETISFMNQIKKNSGKINMSMRLKTSFKFNANIKAQIKPGDMYNTDLSLNFDTKWTGAKKLTYSHSGQMGKNLQIKADLGEGKGKESEYTLSVNVMMKNEYGLNIEVTTDNMANKYLFDGELMMNRQMEKGKLRIEAPFYFMEGQPLEISFTREGSKFASRGNFKMMEYNMDVEYGRRSIMAKAYINWNKDDKGSNFNFTMNFDDTSNDSKTDKKFNMNLIHPVRTVAFSMKYVETNNMLELDTEISANVKRGQKIGFTFGKTQDAGYLKVSLPQRTYKFSGRVNNDSGRQHFDGSFFWDFDNDDSKKIDLTATMFYRNKNAIFDVILKFPPQTKGVQLKSEFSWLKGDTLFKSKTEFSMNQDPSKVFTAQTELLKDDNDKYTLTMAMMHPNNLNMLTTFRMFELNNKLTASMDMKYNNRNANVMAYLDKNNNEISMQVRSKKYFAEIFGHFVMDDDYEISAKIEQEPDMPMEAYIILSPARNSLKIQVNYDDNMPMKSYRINANLLTNQIVTVEAFRMTDEDTYDESDSDVNMKFMLEESNIMHGKITWRPMMVMELNEFFYRKMMENVREMQVMMKKFYDVMDGEKNELYYILYQAYNDDTMEIGNYFYNEFQEIYSETSEMFQQIGEMYQRDYLYLNTIIKELAKHYYEFEYNLVRQISYFEYYFRQGFMEYYSLLLQKMEEAKIQFNQVYQESYRKLSYDIGQARYYIMDKLQRWNRMWEIKRDEYLRKLDQLNRRTYQEIFNHKYTKAFLMAINHRWDELVDFLRSHEMEYLSDMIHYLQTNMNDFKDEVDEFMNELRYHPATQEIFSMMNEIYQQLVWAYKYWEIEETVRNFDDKVKNYITSTANELREQVFSMNDMKIITFDLQSGVIEFQFPFVVPMFFVQNQDRIENFWQMTKHTMNKLNEWQMEYNFTIPDLYYSMKPSSNPADWLPPFKAQASIFRDQHITTFDGVHLDFKGACSYILTRDFVDNNFTVIANFGQMGKDTKILSVTFHAGSEKLEMFHDYQIRHNDNKMDLPMKLNDMSVNRIGNKMEILSRRMFTIIFDPTQGTVIVDISGWYFGRVAGLFGTYNYEQFDDMMMSESRWTTNVDEFAFSWAMPPCRSRQNFAQFERKLNRCENWFLDSYSPFRNCFRQVEPDSYYHACNTVHNPRIDICTVARFYVDRCAEKGVPLELPEQCLMCKTKHGNMFMPDKEFEVSNYTKREELERSADIVFVVEQSKCNQRIAVDLNTIIQRLEQTLQGKGLSDNRYGLVGFGGDNIRQEYSITIRSELMASAGLIMNEIRQLEFHNEYSITDPLKAISLATQYPFRSAVRKTIILVTCNMFCSEKMMPYQRVLRQLRDHDIALHLLHEYDFEMPGNKSPKNSDLYGIDSRQVFTKTEGDSQEKMFETIKMPSDNCAELAFASNGSVFDADKILQGDKSMFSHRFTQRIADSLKFVNCYKCKCGQTEMGMTQSICTRCPSIIEQYSFSPSFYSPGKLFQGNFKINENLKEQLNMYWERFKKNPKTGGPAAKKPAAKKPAAKKGKKGAGKRDARRRRRR